MEDIAPVIAIIFWIVIAFLGKIASAKQKQARSQSGQPGRQQGTNRLESALREMARQAGLNQEIQVAGEHGWTDTEHRSTPQEHQGSFGEHRGTASEHRRTALETHQAISERQRQASEHRLTASEHTKGDARPRARQSEHRRRTRTQRSPFAASLLSGTRGRKNLARAFVLKEIVGPPVSLRDQQG